MICLPVVKLAEIETLAFNLPQSDRAKPAADLMNAVLSTLEGTTAAGDSGGPVFADFGKGPEVVGLVCWGVNPANPSNPYGSLQKQLAANGPVSQGALRFSRPSLSEECIG